MAIELTDEERDVDIVDRDDLDPEFRVNFLYRWIVQWRNGFAISVPTEGEACLMQLRWRNAEGLPDKTPV